MSMLEVVQADREAAAAYEAIRGISLRHAKDITAGRCDETDIIQAFARHRLAAEQSHPGGEVAAKLEAEVAKWEYASRNSRDEQGRRMSLPIVMVCEAIRALSQGASGRLVEAIAKIMPIRVQNGPDYAEVYFADGAVHSTQAMTVNPSDWQEIADAFAALSQGASSRGAGVGAEAGWLIESVGRDLAPQWLETLPVGDDGWTKDSNSALRFSRHEDASNFIKYYLGEPEDDTLRITEHRWL